MKSESPCKKYHLPYQDHGMDYELKRPGGGAGATPKQRAFLAYLGVPCPAMKAEASAAIDQALQIEAISDRAFRWNVDKLSLHPDLYKEEVADRKKVRADALYGMTKDGYGGYPLRAIRKSEVQVVVEWLDAERPGWDAHFWDIIGVVDATYNGYFVPAAANLFPNRVAKRDAELIGSAVPFPSTLAAQMTQPPPLPVGKVRVAVPPPIPRPRAKSKPWIGPAVSASCEWLEPRLRKFWRWLTKVK